MKTWFVFLINGKKVGFWANNYDEANILIEKSQYKDSPREYLGMNLGGFGPEIDEINHIGMSSVDVMIAYGIGKMLIGLRG